MLEEERILLTVDRRVWQPSRSSKTLVVSLPDTTFMAVGDSVKVSVTSRGRIIVEKAEEPAKK